jgi:hypothetical protein
MSRVVLLLVPAALLAAGGCETPLGDPLRLRDHSLDPVAFLEGSWTTTPNVGAWAKMGVGPAEGAT